MLAARLYLHLLGLFRLLQGDQPVAGFDQARLQDLLAYLALYRAAPISRQKLAFLFGPDSTDHQALRNLRTLLTRLRHALPDADHFIAVAAQTIQWRPDAPLTLGAAKFEAAMAQAAAAQACGEVAAAASALASAIATYTGELLPDCYDDWVLALRERYHQAYGDARERVVLLLEEQRDYDRAIPYAQRLLQHEPLHEPAYRHLMRLHLALGSRTDALCIYHTRDTTLQREFGMGPTREARNIFECLISTGGHLGLAAPGRPPETRPADLPLVGRKAGWARLVAAWRTAAAGRPQMFLLTGEAGLGQARLAEELYAWVARQGVATAGAHCCPQGGSAALPHAPVAEWLCDAFFRARLAALDDGRLVEVGAIVRALLAERPHLAPPGPLTEAWQRTRLFEALARAVLGSAPSRGNTRPISRPDRLSDGGSRRNLPSSTSSRGGQVPLLLFLDDLQWVDRETLNWLGYLLRFDPGAPLLIVSAVRQHDVGHDHPPTAFRLELVRSGLPAGLPVGAGGSDGTMASLDTGAATPGPTAITVGTSGAVRKIVGEPWFNPSERTRCYLLTGEPEGPRCFIGGAINNGGLTLACARNKLCPDVEDEAGYERLAWDAASFLPGAEGVFLLPYFAGERSLHWAPKNRGILHGLGIGHSRVHTARAAMEGVATRLADVWDALPRGSETTNKVVRLASGITRAPRWVQILADMLGIPLMAWRQWAKHWTI